MGTADYNVTLLAGHTYKYNPAHPIPGTLQWYKGSNRVKQHVVGRPPYHTPIPSFLQVRLSRSKVAHTCAPSLGPGGGVSVR